jgi:hypothetical protein
MKTYKIVTQTFNLFVFAPDIYQAIKMFRESFPFQVIQSITEKTEVL